MPSKRPILILAAAAVVAAVAVTVALGARQPQPVRAREGRIEVRMDDFRFAPQRIRARAGALEIAVHNEGRLPHALRLMRGGDERGGVPTRKPGESEVLEVELGPGRYRLVCPLSHHEELGMHGVLVVR